MSQDLLNKQYSTIEDCYRYSCLPSGRFSTSCSLLYLFMLMLARSAEFRDNRTKNLPTLLFSFLSLFKKQFISYKYKEQGVSLLLPLSHLSLCLSLCPNQDGQYLCSNRDKGWWHIGKEVEYQVQPWLWADSKNIFLLHIY